MNSKCEVAFVLAAGRGERLRPLTDKTPKPLLPVQGKPILDYVLRQLTPLVTSLGLKRVVLNSWHLGSQVVAYAEGRKSSFGFELVVSEEAELLGTGGGLRQALPWLYPHLKPGPLLMVNGDCLWTGDVLSFVKRGFEDSSTAGSWWLAPKETDQTSVGVNAQRISNIGNLWEDPKVEAIEEGCFTGIQLIKDLETARLPLKGCIIRDYWIPKLKEGARLRGDFQSLESWMDLGTPTRYEKVRD